MTRMATPRANEGAQDDQSTKNSSPEIDPKLALLQDTWLESELEVIELKARKRRGEILGEDLGAAKKRRDVLWKQLLSEWKKGWKRSAKLKSKVARAAAPVEQSSEHDEAEHIEPGEQAEPEDNTGELNEVDEQGNCELVEEPRRKRGRPRGSRTRKRGRPRKTTPTRGKYVPYTNQQKDHIRALICKTLGTRKPPVEEVEPVAQAAGLTIDRVRRWMREFYLCNPTPTLEQVMAWRNNSHRDIPEEWLAAHRDNPYPSQEEKERLARETGKTLQQVCSWFKTVRHWKALTSNPNFSPDQTATLCASFEENIYPSAVEKQRLASETGLSATQVQVWFAGRRQRTGLTAQKKLLPAKKKAPLFAWLHGNMEDPDPSTDKLKELAKETGLTSRQIYAWFRASRKRIECNQGKKEYEGRCPCCGEALDLVAPAERNHEHWEALEEWLTAHRDNPYPSQEEMERLARETGKTLQQVDSWFTKARRKNGLTSIRNLSPDQIVVLSASFEENNYPSTGEMERLAGETGLTSSRVIRWFFHQRTENRQKAGQAALLAWLQANMEKPHLSVRDKEELIEETGLTSKEVDQRLAQMNIRIKRDKRRKDNEEDYPCYGQTEL